MFASPNQLSLFDELQRERPELSDADTIVMLCERLLAEAGARPPVSVEVLASLRGIASIEYVDQPWAGMLEPRGDRLIVRVREGDSHERRRFTVCHEAGHTLFPGFYDQRQFRCDSTKTRLEEWCDLAAAELLLPRRHFLSDIAGSAFGLDAVEELAAVYEASIEATALRFASLWPEPTLILRFRLRHKPREAGNELTCLPKLRLDYSVANGAWPFLRRYKSVSESSPFGRAHLGEMVSETGVLGDLVATNAGKFEIHARRYGLDRRVLALIRRCA